MQANELIKTMRHHDYFYEYTDDQSVWSRGQLEYETIIKELKAVEEPIAKIMIAVFVPDELQQRFLNAVKE